MPSYPCIKPFLYIGGSLLEGIKRGLTKLILECIYSSIDICYILLSTVVHLLVSY
jgi:hypothetical protein